MTTVWILTVMIAGIEIYGSFHSTYEDCRNEGKRKAIEMMTEHRKGAGWDCTPVLRKS